MMTKAARLSEVVRTFMSEDDVIVLNIGHGEAADELFGSGDSKDATAVGRGGDFKLDPVICTVGIRRS